MTQVTILWVASATVTLFGESQIFPLSIGFLSLFSIHPHLILPKTKFTTYYELFGTNSNIFSAK